jgi:hypothetical protein
MRKLKCVSLEVPKELLPLSDEENYAPRKIKRWVENLPMGHRGETTKLLYRHLKHFNSVDIPVNDRFEIMQALSGPVDHTIQSLQRHLLNQPLPLTERSILTAEVVNELLANMVIGYLLIINTGKSRNWLFQRVQQRMWVVSLYQLLRHVERIICVHRMLHFGRPKGLWKGLHDLYVITRNADWHRTPIELDNGATEKTTIENEYKKTLLVALISRHQVRGDQYEDEIVPLLDYWARLTELRAAESGPDQAVSYCILPDADTPPRAMDTKHSMECGGSENGVVLDTSALRLYMLELLCKAGDPVSLEKCLVCKETLELLFDSWCKPHVRKEPRRPGSGTLTVALGLSHTNHIVAARYQDDCSQEVPDVVPLESLRSVLAPLFEASGNAGHEMEDHVEITTIDYEKEEVHRARWAEFNRRNGYAPLKAEVINVSDHGYCLSVVPPESEHVRNGDVIGIYNASKDTWNLGQLVWMKGEPAHKILMGVRIIATCVLPVRLRIVVGNNQYSEALPALIGHDSEGEPLIALPYLPAIRQKSFIVDYRGHFTPIELKYRVITTPSFTAYKLTAAGDDSPAKSNTVERPFTEKIVMEKPPRTGTSARLDDLLHDDECDEYAHLWDKL